MNLSDDEVIGLLRNALPSVASAPPGADLWPRVRYGVTASAPPPGLGDWLVAAAVVLLCVLRPSLTAILLLHF